MLAGAAVLEATAQAFVAPRRPAARRTPARRAWRPARRPAATSAASRRRRCASMPTRTIRSSTCASTTTPSRWPSCSGSTQKSLERFQPFVACLPGRHDPVGVTDRRRDRGPHRAPSPRRAARRVARRDERRACSRCASCARTSAPTTASSRRSTASSFDVEAGPHAGHRRRIGLRQERHRAVDHGAGAEPAGPHRRRLDPLRGPRAGRRCRGARCRTCAATAWR